MRSRKGVKVSLRKVQIQLHNPSILNSVQNVFTWYFMINCITARLPNKIAQNISNTAGIQFIVHDKYLLLVSSHNKFNWCRRFLVAVWSPFIVLWYFLQFLHIALKQNAYKTLINVQRIELNRGVSLHERRTRFLFEP